MNTQVTIHKAPGVTVEVIEGSPPVDQSALVAEQASTIATMEAQLLSLTQNYGQTKIELSSAIIERDTLAAKINAFKAAVEGLLA